jgi:outer membrane protein assembly factor BamA
MHKSHKYLLISFSISFLLTFFSANAQYDKGDISTQAPLQNLNSNEINKDSSDQNIAPFTIRQILIYGNKKTKASIILRELPFKPGDHLQLQKLVSKFDDARKQLMNTALFHEVVVALKSIEGNDVDVMIQVKERWYLFPVPYFRMVDRNLNQWLVQHKASLDRVNYGVKLMYNNTTGRNDKLNIWLMNGYTKQVSLSYDRMYLDKKMKWGARLGFAMGKNREVNYNTINNKEIFLKDPNNFIRSFLRTNFELTYRHAIKTRHSFGIVYTAEKVKDTVVKLNPSYFTSGHHHIYFPEVYYKLTYFDVDYIPHPLKGFEAEIFIDKKGFNHNVNVWELNVSTGNYWQVFPKTYFNVITMASLKLPFKQPFFNTKLLGYGETYMQGYEYYVVDGITGGYLKTTLSREFFKFNVHLPKNKYRTIDYVPFHIYGKIFGNAGYVYNPKPGANFLTNRILYSEGVGLDILTFYDINIMLEWSFNQLGQNGLYLHRNSNF